ncbi:Alpha/Beta hydrolase protein [Pavlovales sp. CCMP2436]|nr:Alpha/Beta hydrolase protein [Pavlovales sp. CCMP2436]|mmetsp:Transcript_4481/g.11484  ORF Transcript_4481/g.11484 Transcript_4481/m.11484 type:complete len:222 (+) Transcript_4481:162-827(+)
MGPPSNVMNMMYLHGWASGPGSAKGRLLAAALATRGVPLTVPNLNCPAFEQLTYTGALSAISEAAALGTDRWNLVGSSMGGYLAARWAELHPERVNRLVLLCPGFDLLERLPIVFRDPNLYERWEREGCFSPGYGPDGPSSRISFDFVADARLYPARPRIKHPTLILHGVADNVIPLASSQLAACEHPECVQLVELEDGHDLVGVASSGISELTMRWLGVG